MAARVEALLPDAPPVALKGRASAFLPLSTSQLHVPDPSYSNVDVRRTWEQVFVERRPEAVPHRGRAGVRHDHGGSRARG